MPRHLDELVEPVRIGPTHRAGRDDTIDAGSESVDAGSGFDPPAFAFVRRSRQIGGPSALANGGTPPARGTTVEVTDLQLRPVTVADGHLDRLDQLDGAGKVLFRCGQAASDLGGTTASFCLTDFGCQPKSNGADEDRQRIHNLRHRSNSFCCVWRTIWGYYTRIVPNHLLL